MKLKEWKFDKNVPSKDMGFVVAKAEKRAREEGKETEFFFGQTSISNKKIETFKKRRFEEMEDASALEAGECFAP